MGRRSLMRGAAAAGLAGLGSGAALARAEAGESANGDAHSLVRTPPVYMGPRPDGFDLVWGVTRHARGWAELRPAGGGEPVRFDHDGNGYVPQSRRYLHVPVHGLPARARGEFRVITESMEGVSERVESDWRPFRLPDASADSARFAVWNDTHERDATLTKLDEITPRDIDSLIWNGDITNDWHQDDWFASILLNPGNTDFTNHRPLCFIHGNHDVRGKYGFLLPRHTPMPGGRTFFAARFGPVACLFLNTGEDKDDNHPSFRGRVAFDKLRREQAEWMADITRSDLYRDAPYRVMFCHLPMRWTDERTDRDFDRFSWRSRQYWHDHLVSWGTQVVISGHTHRPGWLPAADDFPYAQLVGGGPQMERATLITGDADGDALRLKMVNMEGETLREVEFPPLA